MINLLIISRNKFRINKKLIDRLFKNTAVEYSLMRIEKNDKTIVSHICLFSRRYREIARQIIRYS